MDNPMLTEVRLSLVKLRTLLVAAVAFFLTASIPAQTASAQSRERSGKDVVDAVCATCHQTGAKGAPRIGDEKA